jgi:hypothetical protein
MGRMPRTIASPLLVLILAGVANAAEPVGCDKFAWPLARERGLLLNPNKTSMSMVSSQALDRANSKAVALALVPSADAHLPMAPERAPKSADSFAGLVHFAGAAKPGAYKLTLSDAAWADIIQDGKFVKSIAFTGATGCTGVRKSVKFELSAAPFVVQISGAANESIAFVLTPAN